MYKLGVLFEENLLEDMIRIQLIFIETFGKLSVVKESHNTKVYYILLNLFFLYIPVNNIFLP